MAFDSFLVFQTGGTNPTIQGETTDSYFSSSAFSNTAVVQLVDFSFGMHNTIAIGSTSTGAGVGKAQFNELKVTKRIDKSSASLFKAASTGAHFAVVQLYIRKAGGNANSIYLGYEFQLVYVSEIDWSGSSGDETPSESVTFEYGALAVAYHPQNPDGTLAAPIIGRWNEVTNTNVLQTPSSLVGF
jgi:type VI secretion system secreted protein Hcp